jgi:hypothetical protein
MTTNDVIVLIAFLVFLLISQAITHNWRPFK